MKFIYVMDKKAADILLKRKFNLLKADEANSIWIFENEEPDNMEFSLDVPHVLSDVLTF